MGLTEEDVKLLLHESFNRAFQMQGENMEDDVKVAVVTMTENLREKVNAAMSRVVNDDVRMCIAAAGIGMMPSEMLALYVQFNAQKD